MAETSYNFTALKHQHFIISVFSGSSILRYHWAEFKLWLGKVPCGGCENLFFSFQLVEIACILLAKFHFSPSCNFNITASSHFCLTTVAKSFPLFSSHIIAAPVQITQGSFHVSRSLIWNTSAKLLLLLGSRNSDVDISGKLLSYLQESLLSEFSY